MSKLIKNKKIILMLIVIISLVFVIGRSFAFIKFDFNQNELSKVKTQCIKISLADEANDITLRKTFPISKEEGEKLTPYTFSVENTCDNALDYDIALEVLNVTDSINSRYIDVKIDDKASKTLESANYSTTDPTYKDNDYTAVESYVLTSGLILAHTKETHNLRLWIDEDADNTIQNKTFASKVSINATLPNEVLDTPSVLVYKGEDQIQKIDNLEIIQEKTIYTVQDITLKLSSNNPKNKFYYSETVNGEKIAINNGELPITATTAGKTLYLYLEDANEGMSKNYIKLNILKTSLQNKTINLAAGSSVDIGDIAGSNSGDISYGDIVDTTIAELSNGKIVGKKGGTTTMTVTESLGGASATVTINVSEITLSENAGLIQLGDDLEVSFTNVNNQAISASSSDESVATAEIINNKLKITSIDVGNATITVSDEYGYEVTYEIKVVSIEFSPNGGSYILGSNDSSTVTTDLTIQNGTISSYGWSNSNSVAPTTYTETSNSNISETFTEEGSYYLWVKINDNDSEVIAVSNAFIITEQSIIITPSVTTYTKDPYSVTITYPTLAVSGTEKAAFGTNLTNARNNISSATAPTTSITVSENGYIFATAQDSMGNEVTATLNIDRFDIVTAPTITGGNEQYSLSREISISQAGTASSGVDHYEYYVSSTSGVTDGTTATGTTSNKVTITTEGTNYIYYRTVSSVGVKSSWSNEQKVNIYYQASSISYTNSNFSSVRTVADALDYMYSLLG